MNKESRDKVRLLKTLYGGLRKVDNNYYLTTKTSTHMQDLINIHTGDKVDEIFVTIEEIYNPKSRKYRTRYYDSIYKSKHTEDLLYVFPDARGHKDEVRIYNSDSKVLNIPLAQYTTIHCREIELANNKLLALLMSHLTPRTFIIVIYNKVNRQVEDVYKASDIKTVYADHKLIVSKLNNDNSITAIEYIAEKQELFKNT